MSVCPSVRLCVAKFVNFFCEHIGILYSKRAKMVLSIQNCSISIKQCWLFPFLNLYFEFLPVFSFPFLKRISLAKQHSPNQAISLPYHNHPNMRYHHYDHIRLIRQFHHYDQNHPIRQFRYYHNPPIRQFHYHCYNHSIW